MFGRGRAKIGLEDRARTAGSKSDGRALEDRTRAARSKFVTCTPFPASELPFTGVVEGEV
jgi:hypothetical protein